MRTDQKAAPLERARKSHGSIDYASWMAHVNDDIMLSALSIPGTHDSAAYTINVPFIATQRLDVIAQLNAGIRYLDLRCGLRHNELQMVHGPTLLGITLDNLLASIYDWLEQHDTEALIIQIKKDREDVSSTRTFSRAVLDTLAGRPERWLTTNTTLVLGQARGKIQLFRRFRGQGVTAYGINVSRWQDNPSKPFTMLCGHGIEVTVQDHYKYIDAVPLPELVSQKLVEVKALLQRAAQDQNGSHWYINFTSALEFNWSYRYAPRDVAEGSWYAFQRVQGLNDGLSEIIRSHVAHKRYGILAMDFPDTELIELIISTNFGRECNLVLVVIATLTISIAMTFLLLQHDQLSSFMNRLSHLSGIT